jgi:hypothetical protein
MSVAERSSVRQLQRALPVFAILLAAGCKKPPEQGDQGSRAQQAIMREVEANYDIGPERPALAITDTAFPGPSTDGNSPPRMTIATLKLKPGHPKPPRRLIARIKSDGDYPAMGIYAGMNFIRRNSWDPKAAASWVTEVVSLKPSTSPYQLHRDVRMHEYTSGDAAEPRLVQVTKASFAFAACLDDPMCGSGHCGYW